MSVKLQWTEQIAMTNRWRNNYFCAFTPKYFLTDKFYQDCTTINCLWFTYITLYCVKIHVWNWTLLIYRYRTMYHTIFSDCWWVDYKYVPTSYKDISKIPRKLLEFWFDLRDCKFKLYFCKWIDELIMSFTTLSKACLKSLEQKIFCNQT